MERDLAPLDEPKTKSQETQTMMGTSDMERLDSNGEYLGSVLDYYVKHSSTEY